MKRLIRKMCFSLRWQRLAGFALAGLLATNAAHAQAPNVLVLEIDGTIGVTTADYINDGLERAREIDAELIIINMDTPGGLISPMRDIIQDILNSPIPVASFVTPAGARADSAGTFIMMGSNIAAMTPTSHLGAATPVSLTGDDATPQPIFDPPDTSDDGESDEEGGAEDEESEEPAMQPGTSMERKVLNDSISYIRSLAERYGRNADWAEKAVTEAATLTAREALEQNVIDIVAEDQQDLLGQLDGREVKVQSSTVTLSTANVNIEEFVPNWRIRLLSVITSPEILLILMAIAFYGLLIEGWNPGGIVPGVLGAIALVLFLYAVQVIPINYAGVALILLGLALMTAEAFAPSFGALGLGGIAAFVFGAIMMFDADIPGFGISIQFVIITAIAAALFIIWLMTQMLKLRQRGAVSGAESIVGGVGTAMDAFQGEGKIWLEGEAWAAESAVPIDKDQDVVVRKMDGLVLTVEPVSKRNTE